MVTLGEVLLIRFHYFVIRRMRTELPSHKQGQGQTGRRLTGGRYTQAVDICSPVWCNIKVTTISQVSGLSITVILIISVLIVLINNIIQMTLTDF